MINHKVEFVINDVEYAIDICIFEKDGESQRVPELLFTVSNEKYKIMLHH